MYPVLHLGPGQSLVSGLVLRRSSGFSLSFLLPQQRVVSQDPGVGLQYVVEHVEAVRTADLRAPAQGTGLWVVQVLVGAHQSQQLQLQRADLLCDTFRVRLVQIPPAGLQKFVENWEI